jgi:hypothetical protein
MGAVLTAAAAGTLPDVSFIDPSAFATQTINGHLYQTDEHPPTTSAVRAEYVVSQVINALRSGPAGTTRSCSGRTTSTAGSTTTSSLRRRRRAASRRRTAWPGTVRGPLKSACKPAAGSGGELRPQQDGGRPGHLPGLHPTGPYPADCATFNQLGFRVPFVAVSPFSKPHYVSHITGSHTSLLALIEKRFSCSPDRPRWGVQHARGHVRLRQLAVVEHRGQHGAAPHGAGDNGCPF